MDQIKTKLKNLPQKPGVYLYSDSNGKIIYVGKASNLKNRVSSYFVPLRRGYEGYSSPHDTKTEMLVSNIANIDYKITSSVLEALILEASLIKKYQPKYNIKLKDDKSYVNIYITKEEYPKVFIERPNKVSALKIVNCKLKIARVFGPFISKDSATEALKLLRKIFRFRDCGMVKYNQHHKRQKPCLFYSLDLCSAPCSNKINKVDYTKDVRKISKILSGKTKLAISELKKQMLTESKKQNYEQATILRNQIFALTHIKDASLITKEPSIRQLEDQPTTDKKPIVNRIEAYDISNIGGKYATGSMVVWENNECNKSEYKKFKIKLTSEPNDLAMLYEVISRRAKHNDWKKPDIILVDGGKNQIIAAEKAIQGTFLEHTPIMGVVKNVKHNPIKIIKNSFAQKIEIDKKILFKIDAESHRFAIKYHRLLRSKGMLK